MIFIILLVFIFGLVWGSFLNVVIYRTTHGTSPLSGRSNCPKCHKTISWKHNIPLISFFLLHGKCANCKTRISWQYPVVEFMTGILFVWWYFMGRSFFMLLDNPWNYVQPVFWLVMGMLLLVVFIADLRFGLIPDQVSLPLFILALGYRLGLVTTNQMQSPDLVKAVISGLVLTLFFYCLWYFTKGRGFGYGDVKLAPSLGLLLGWPKTLTGMFIAFVSGAVVAVVLLIFRKKKMSQTIPFGPFLVWGSVAALLWGQQLWSWYWGLL